MNAPANPPVAVEVLPVTPFQQNCSLIVCQRTKKAALVDPGGEVDRLLAAVARHGATLGRQRMRNPCVSDVEMARAG